MQPLLLRSAGVVGLAGAILAVISSDALFVGSESGPEKQAEPAIVQGTEVGAKLGVIAIRAPVPAELVAPATGVFEKSALPDVAVDPTPAPTAAADPVPAAKPDPVAEPGAAMAAAPAAADAPPEAAPPPAAPTLAPAEISPAGSEGAAMTETASLWPEEAVACPRDWVAVDAAGQPAPRPADCSDDAAVPASADAALTEHPALNDAALERASEVAALQFVPRIPQARPDPPPPSRRKAARRSNWPAGDPPNCGSKRAKWRYVNKTPTWYCR